MKYPDIVIKTILLYLALFLIVSTTEAQSHYPLQPTSCWRVDSVNATWDIVENTKYFFNGDTIIQNSTFFKLYKSGVVQYNTPFYYNNVYVGAMRDSADKIYYIKKNRTSETLLFDFNLKVGDTIKSSVGKGEKIISIDTLQNGRKAFYIKKDHYNLSYFIEGIGSNGGLFNTGKSFVELHSGEMANYLVCYSENNMLAFQSEVTRISNCDIVNIGSKFPVDTTSIWRIDCDSDYYVSHHSEKYQYFIEGDTFIGKNSYSKLYKTGFYLTREDGGAYKSSFKKKVYAGALRDSERKYYFVDQSDAEEKVLYDFNLNIGDTVKSEIYKDEIVYSIDTCYDNRRKFYLGSEKYTTKIIIEGIGSIYDFIEGYKPGLYLICFSQNDIPVYHSGVNDCRLDLQSTTFYACDNVFLLPSWPTTNDNIKLELVTCYPVPENSTMFPSFSSFRTQKDDFTINVQLYYVNDILPSTEGVNIPYTLFDTISLGQLSQGSYKVNCNVNTIHTLENTDTIFNEKSFMWNFSVSWSDVVSTKETTLTSQISVYPNPTRDKITINITNSPAGLLSYELYDIQGKKILSERFYNSDSLYNYEIDTKLLQSGIYFLKLNCIDSFTTHKILIEK